MIVVSYLDTQCRLMKGTILLVIRDVPKTLKTCLKALKQAYKVDSSHLKPLFEQKSRAPENSETLENIGDRERIRTAGLPLRSIRLIAKI